MLVVGLDEKGDKPMQLDYQKILNDYGFESVPEAEDTTLAFYHEIPNILFDDDSPFDVNKFNIDTFPNVLRCMVQCSLPLKPSKTLLEGVQYLIAKWYSDLCYEKPRFESIHRTSSVFGTEVRILTISEGTGCSFLFTITDEAAERFSSDFMDSYDGVDNPDEVLTKISSPKSN